MAKNEEDTPRAFAAAKVIIDGRNPISHRSEILVTAEHAVAALLLLLMNNDPRAAAGMLNEGLVAGVEDRLAYYASKIGEKK